MSSTVVLLIDTHNHICAIVLTTYRDGIVECSELKQLTTSKVTPDHEIVTVEGEESTVVAR